MSDRDKAHLRGNVSVCETVYPCPPFQYKGRYTLCESFHPDGRRNETIHEHANGVDWTHHWLYHNDKLLREETCDGTFPFRRTFTYDARRRLDGVLHQGGQGRHLEESYVHHEDGTSTCIWYRHPELELGNGLCPTPDSMLHVSGDAVCIVTLRDRRDNPLEKVLYDSERRPIQRVLFVYDDAGRLLEEGEAYSDNSIRDDFRNLYRYDAQGRCIEKEVRTPFSGERQTMVHNEYGDVSEVHRSYLDAGIDLFHSSPSTTHFSYEYDGHGNWLTCRIETRTSDTGEATHGEEQRRRLTYWDPL